MRIRDQLRSNAEQWVVESLLTASRHCFLSATVTPATEQICSRSVLRRPGHNVKRSNMHTTHLYILLGMRLKTKKKPSSAGNTSPMCRIRKVGCHSTPSFSLPAPRRIYTKHCKSCLWLFVIRLSAYSSPAVRSHAAACGRALHAWLVSKGRSSNTPEAIGHIQRPQLRLSGYLTITGVPWPRANVRIEHM
jgi:hypothetical protein